MEATSTPVAGTLPGTRPGAVPAAAPAGAWWQQVSAVYQPVVELGSREVVGYEALVRGPRGSALESPVALFEAARRTGRLAELDWACRLAAHRGALERGVPDRLGLFLNVEPAALNTPPPPGSEALLDRAVREVPVVMEITERALTGDPAGLLRSAARARERGWRVAVDDVGADRASLALLPFLAPEIIKLDLRLVQDHTAADTAGILAAVHAEAERTGALVLAEGIETEEHAHLALAMGATLGQGWLFGRPGPLPARDDPRLPRLGPQVLTPAVGIAARQVAERRARPTATPFDAVRDRAAVRRATGPELAAAGRELHRQALAAGEAAVVLAALPRAEHLTPDAVRRWAELGERCAFTAVFAAGLGPEQVPGVRAVDLEAADPLEREWDVTVVGPHWAGALLARRVDGEDDLYDCVVTHDRDAVLAAASLLLHRVPEAATPQVAGPIPAPRTPSGSQRA